MNHQIELLTTQQQRVLNEACWKFEQELADGKTVNPLDYVALCPDVPPDVLLTELDEIHKERRALKSSTGVTKPTSVNGRYNFIEEIARGGAAVVWRAFDSHLQRETAVKFLLDSQDNACMRKRLEIEARLCARLVHPGIVPVHELSSFPDGRPFVSMKLVNGRTLLQLLDAKPPISTSAAVEIFSGVCQAMAYAHSQGIIHRDLKPSNIMVGAFGEIQIMDWGLGKELDSLSDSGRTSIRPLIVKEPDSRFNEDQLINQTAMISTRVSMDSTLLGSVLGTLNYMAPEQACGDIHSTDRRSDVFALGAILCKILTGAPPYVAQDHEGLLLKSQKGDLQEAYLRLRATRHKSLADLSIRCMSVQSQDRPQDAQAIFEILQKIDKTKIRRKRFAISSGLLVFLTLSIWISGLYSNRPSLQLIDRSSTSNTPTKRIPTLGIVLDLVKSHEFEAADQQFRELVNRKPSDLESRRRYCVALLNSEKHKEAEKLARELLELNSTEPEYPFLLSETLYFQGEFEAAYAAMQASKQLRDQGSPTPLKIDDKLAYLNQTLSLLSLMNSREQDELEHMSSGELRHLATICDILHKVNLAIRFNNLWIEMEPDDADKSFHRYQLTNPFCKKHLSRQDLSTSDRNLIIKALGKWMTAQLLFVQRGTANTKRPQTEIAEMQKALKVKLDELVESDLVQQALEAKDVDRETLDELKQVIVKIQETQAP